MVVVVYKSKAVWDESQTPRAQLKDIIGVAVNASHVPIISVKEVPELAFHPNDPIGYVVKMASVLHPEASTLTVVTDSEFKQEHLDLPEKLVTPAEYYGEEVFTKIQESKSLVIGAGGIGCELMKIMSHTGFKNIEITDMDTIALSNLNRQLLFTEVDIGKFKSQVVKEALTKLKPDVDIKAHQLKVQESYFDVNKVTEFDTVFGALDNNDARRYINKIAMRCGTPYIDGGTGGYRGQVSVIVPSKQNQGCLGCQGVKKEKEAASVSCSVRNRPENFFHCLLWAKSVFELQFSCEVADKVDEKTQGDYCQNYATTLYNELFVDDIVNMIETSKNTPFPRNDIKPLALDSILSSDWAKIAALPFDPFVLWDLPTAASHFLQGALSLRLRQVKGGVIDFEKEDDDIMKWITAAAVLRAFIFAKTPESFIQAQIRLGNIAPALGTTNAVISGIQVTKFIKYLTNRQSFKSSESWFNENRNISLTATAPKTLDCDLCGSLFAIVSIDVYNITLKQFVESFFIELLNIRKPTLSLNDWTIVENGEFQIDKEQYSKSLYDSVLKKSQYLKLVLEAAEKAEIIEFYLKHSPEDLEPSVELSQPLQALLVTYALNQEESDEGDSELKVIIKTNKGHQFELPVDPFAPLKELMETVRSRLQEQEGNNLVLNKLAFFANGERLASDETADDMCLASGMVIDAYIA